MEVPVGIIFSEYYFYLIAYQVGLKAGQAQVKRIPGEVIKKINQAVGFRMVTKFGSKGVINLGNVHEQKFGDIIGSERAQNLVDGFSRREAVEELCKKCGFRQKFGMDSELPDI